VAKGGISGISSGLSWPELVLQLTVTVAAGAVIGGTASSKESRVANDDPMLWSALRPTIARPRNRRQPAAPRCGTFLPLGDPGSLGGSSGR
jgi:hypothetical protein